MDIDLDPGHLQRLINCFCPVSNRNFASKCFTKFRLQLIINRPAHIRYT